MSHRYQQFAGMLFVVLVHCGCESGAPNVDYSSLGLVNVSGQITLDGSPLSGGSIQFVAEDGTYSSGRTDAEGRYTLQFNSEQAGVLPGKKIVRITAGAPDGDSDDRNAGTAETDGSGPLVSDSEAGRSVPSCYHEDSQLQLVVTTATTRFDFELKSDCSTTGPRL